MGAESMEYPSAPARVGAGASRIGGYLCLDFVNALEEWGGGYTDLVAWGARAGLLSAHDAGHLAGIAAGDPAALRALRQAVALRQVLYQLFSAVAAGAAPEPRALDTLSDSIGHALGRLRLTAGPQGEIGWAWGGDPGALDRPLWPIVRDAADLLTGAERCRVRACEGAHCDRLFVDRSRNHSRRWCEMAHCGMLAKSRRHYARARTARGSTSAVEPARAAGLVDAGR